MTDEATPEATQATESVAKQAKKPVSTIHVKALRSFGAEETGDLRKGEQAVLPKSKVVATLIKSGLLAEVTE